MMIGPAAQCGEGESEYSRAEAVGVLTSLSRVDAKRR